MHERTTSKKQLCLNCFARGHQLRECISTQSCFTCRARHHTLLHKGNPNSRGSTSAISSSAGPQNPAVQGAAGSSENLPRVQNYLATGSRAGFLGTAIIDICLLGTNYRARALIDSGSEATFITERLFNLIQLPFRHIQAQVSGHIQARPFPLKRPGSAIFLFEPLKSQASS